MTTVELHGAALPLHTPESKLTQVKGQGQQVLGFYGARKQRTSLSIQTKLEVIKYAEENPTVTQNKIASHFGIDRTTVSKVLKRKAQFKAGDENDAKSENGSESGRAEDSPRRSPDHVTGINGIIANKHRRNHSSLLNNKPSHRLTHPHTPTQQQIPSSKLEYQLKSTPRDLDLSAHALDTQHNDLYDKCESWFMKQRFTTASKKHEKDIISYSCLISPLPLSMLECARIIPAKLIKDEAFAWITKQLNGQGHAPLNPALLVGKGEALLARYMQEEAPALRDKMAPLFFPDTPPLNEEEVRRVWVRYVSPRLRLFDTEPVTMTAPADMRADLYANQAGLPPSPKRLKTPQCADTSALLPVIPSPGLINSLTPMLLVPSSTPSPVTSPVTPVTSQLATAMLQSLAIPRVAMAPSSPSNGPHSDVLDLSMTENQHGAVDLSQGSPDKSSAGNVRGSRKRKMNTHPVRITQQPEDGTAAAEYDVSMPNGSESRNRIDSSKHPELLRCLDVNGGGARALSNGYHDDEDKHPVIEIIPDSCRPVHNNGHTSPSSLKNSLKSSPLMTTKCDNNNSDLPNNNKRSHSMLSLLHSVSALSQQMGKNHERLNERAAGSRSPCNCSCESEQLRVRVASLEDKVDQLQASLDKLSKPDSPE